MDIHEQIINKFGANGLYLCDIVKSIMQKHKLDYRDRNLVEAMLTVAIQTKKILDDKKTEEIEMS